MNIKMVGKYLGYLIGAEAVFLLPSVAVGLIYGEYPATFALLATAGICAVVAAALWFLCRKAGTAFFAREGFVVAGAGWILVSLLGALPFYFSGEIPRYYHAFFESASGFTTTGASILTNVEALSRCLLFWRSFTHWVGGIGVLAFILATVQSKKGAGFTMHLMRAETPGPQKGKIEPQMRNSMRGLLAVYGGLSLVNFIFLLAGGMPVFDALCTMFGTAGTGGFGIKNDSMGSYSTYLQMVTAVFMALFGVNFSLYYLILRKHWRDALRDEELRLYFGIMGASTLAIGLSLIIGGIGKAGWSLRHSFFTVSSIMTTTGFSTVDFDLWPQFCRILILTLMIFGAMAGSTGGGMKITRLLILLKSMRAGLNRLLHPRSVKKVAINGKTLDDEVINRNYLYLLVYCALMLVGMLLLGLDGATTIETDLSAMFSCVNNIGPGLNQIGPAANYSIYTPLSTLVLTLSMLLGRLEIFPILLLFYPGTWSRKN